MAMAAPHRILSLNVCADQYILALADRGSIAALSEFAADPQLSASAARAQRLPRSKGRLEEVLRINPDLVVIDAFYPARTVELARARGIRVVAMRTERGFPDIVANVRVVAAAIGKPKAGERLIADMARDLAAMGISPGRGRVAAHYQRRGFVTGTGTLLDDMMRRVGLVNLAAARAIGPLGRLSLEEIAMARPDFVIMDDDLANVRDKGAEMLIHPLLARAIPVDRRIAFPSAYTVCGGPHYPAAVHLLAARIGQADRTRR